MKKKSNLKEFVPVKGERLKNDILELLDELLQTVENFQDEEDEDYEEVSNRIEEARKLQEEFEKWRPAIYVYVEGGNIQGMSGNCDISVDVYDKDNYDVGGDEYIETDGTPEEWDKMIKEKTEAGEIKSIY